MNTYVTELITRYPALTPIASDAQQTINLLINTYENGGKLLLCGNGGSAADCGHIVGELMKGFLKKRPLDEAQKDALKSKNSDVEQNMLDKLQQGLPAISLCEPPALITAFSNDVDPEYIFAQQVLALGAKNDVLLGVSTSGNAKNVYAAASIAKGMGLKVIGMTGEGGGKLAKIADITLKAPDCETYRIQEYHLPIYHAICAAVEEHFFKQ